MRWLGWLVDLFVVLTDPIMLFLMAGAILSKLLFSFLHKLKTTHESKSAK